MQCNDMNLDTFEYMLQPVAGYCEQGNEISLFHKREWCFLTS